MSGKSKITGYFARVPASATNKQKTSPLKEVTNEVRNQNNDNIMTTPDSKRTRIDPDLVNEQNDKGKMMMSPEGKMMLSPEQKERCEANKIEARKKLLSKKMALISSNMGNTWFKALENEFKKPYFQKLNDFILQDGNNKTIFPKHEDIWSWTMHTSIEDIRVVILGQDPYHGPGQAHGLCFSVQPGVPSPPSLVNMYKELEADIQGFTRPTDRGGYLAGWSEQGVLLLNAVLTVRKAEANSHKDKGWEKLTDAVIKWISDNNKDVVFLLWGSYAQKKASMVDKKKHHLLKAVHPSPLSAHRGFLGCKHFSQCNQILIENKKQPIDWNNLPQIKY